MTEPVPGIKASPDEQNARYFHVVVAGPKDVRHIQFVAYIILSCNNSLLLRTVRSNWNCFFRRSIRWLRPKFDL